MRVLITEDDPIGRKVLELFLLPYAEVIAVGHGEEALSEFTAAWESPVPFNLVFLDIGLPGKSGIEILSLIREFERSKGKRTPTPVIMLTGNSEEEQISKALELGISHYLMKPVEESKLLTELRDLGLIGTPDGTL